MKSKLDEIIEANAPTMIEQIKKIVQIPSVQTTSSKDAPFGIKIKEALTYTLDLSKQLGLEIKNIDNYIGYASYGESEDYVCAIGHLDVVPEGKGWSHPPYSGYEENGILYSRGILDNKGPIYACLFALYAIKQANLPIKRSIRIIFGCNEETGFNDLKYYLSKETPPLYGFTPDCKYPVIYAERGRAVIKLTFTNTKKMHTFINQYIFKQQDLCQALSIADKNEEFGKNECRNYHIEDHSFTFSLSYIPTTKIEIVIEHLKNMFNHINIELIHNYNPVFFNKESKMVKIMNDIYNQKTNSNLKPVTTTGGTYAKLMPNIVPFGPSFPGQKGIGHLPNEWMKIDDIILNAKIYAETLYQLANLEE